MRRPARLVFSLGLALQLFPLISSSAFADETHGIGSGGVDPISSTALYLFLGALFALTLGAYLVGFGPLQTTPLGQSDYLKRVRNFSRNAKLLLVRALLNGLNFGLWAVLFNLYLLAVGFDVTFLGQVISLNWLTHGIVVVPAGILSDMLGRRNTFLIAYSFTTLFRLARIVTLDPNLILLFSALGGFSEGFHSITGAPFMAEQSRREERVHLFSVDGAAISVSLTVGNLLAGALPLMLAPFLGLSPGSGDVLRAALVFAIPLALLSMVPIYYINERWHRISAAEWFAQLKSKNILGMLGLTTAIQSVALGLTVPFYNVFFAMQFRANPEQVGLIFGLATVAISFSSLIAPLITQRLGRVNTIVGVQLLGLPLLVGMAYAPVLWLAAAMFMFRQVFSGTAGGPGGGLAAPIYRLFSMEIVQPKERGTANGLVHAFNEFPMAVGGVVAGSLMAGGEWGTIFSLASAFMAASLAIYYLYFRRFETRAVSIAAAPAGGAR